MLATSQISLAAWPLLFSLPVPFSFWLLTLTSLLSQLLQAAHFPEQLQEATCCPWRSRVCVSGPLAPHTTSGLKWGAHGKACLTPGPLQHGFVPLKMLCPQDFTDLLSLPQSL